MTFSTYLAAALTVLMAPAIHADVTPTYRANFPFPEDKVNATVTVNFNGYNVTAPFSNSSEANTPWQAHVKVRGPVRVDETSDDFDPESDDDDTFYISVAEISLTYNVSGADDVEEPDESWGYCVGTQVLFNLTAEADDSIDPTCQGVLDQECIDWLQDYVNRGGPCPGSGDGLIHEQIARGPCSKDQFPEYSDNRIPDREAQNVQEWGTMVDSTLGELKQQYSSNGPTDDIGEYDLLLPQVYVLLASWGERNSSDETMADRRNVLNGTVLCLRANETAEGSRTIEEVIEDGAVAIGRGRILAIAVSAMTVLIMSVVF
ncbi:hypothetical protein CC79DRAFT_1323376 [Sarocladium strictum]